MSLWEIENNVWFNSKLRHSDILMCIISEIIPAGDETMYGKEHDNVSQMHMHYIHVLRQDMHLEKDV